MGFLDYAYSLSLQKDNMKAGIRIDQKLQHPKLLHNTSGFTITLPMPTISENEDEEKTISFLGYKYSSNNTGKEKIGKLFRACVFHLTAHTLIPIDKEKDCKLSHKSIVNYFTESLVNDVYINSYLARNYPDKLADIAYANTLAYLRMRPVNTIFNPATRLMTALLSKMNVGIIKGTLEPKEKKAFDYMLKKLRVLKGQIIKAFCKEEINVKDILKKTAFEITRTLEDFGPILEAPSLLYTEQLGACLIFSQQSTFSESEEQKVFRKSFETLSETKPSEVSIETFWRKETNIEAIQAFNTWASQEEKEKRMLAKIEKYVSCTKLKDVSIPSEDYSKYLKSRALINGTNRRLLDSLRVAQDALDEDPGKLYGELDLPTVVQMMVSGQSRDDVFLRDEYLSRSFAWSVLFDVSASMGVRGEQARAISVCIAEATKELLMDPGSWTFFGFSDRFYILKDAGEAYSRRVRARIGGIKFEGLTYMPDALKVAGEILNQRFDEQKFLIVISDGYPYGYSDISVALSKTISALEKKGLIVIGVGLGTDRMKDFFRLNAAVYNQRELIKTFAKLYVKASAAALE